MCNEREKEFIGQLATFKSNSDKFSEWPAIKVLKSKAINKKTGRIKSISLRFILVAAVCAVAHIFYGSLEESNKECLLSNSEVIQDWFRPPAQDCEFCKIDSIHVRSNLSEEEFYQKYAFTGLPLLVEDGMSDWTTEKFGYSYFKELYKEHEEELKEVLEGNDNGCQFFGYKSDLQSMDDLFTMREERATFQPGTEPWYIGWSNCVDNITLILRQDYKVPYFIGRSESTKQDWIFMGSPGYKGAPLHIDFVDFNSWQAQIKGHKLWRFIPPPECWNECPNHEHSIVVKPGNVFVFDSNRWFHSTEVLPGEYSLTIGAEYD